MGASLFLRMEMENDRFSALWAIVDGLINDDLF